MLYHLAFKCQGVWNKHWVMLLGTWCQFLFIIFFYPEIWNKALTRWRCSLSSLTVVAVAVWTAMPFLLPQEEGPGGLESTFPPPRKRGQGGWSLPFLLPQEEGPGGWSLPFLPSGRGARGAGVYLSSPQEEGPGGLESTFPPLRKRDQGAGVYLSSSPQEEGPGGLESPLRGWAESHVGKHRVNRSINIHHEHFTTACWMSLTKAFGGLSNLKESINSNSLWYRL